MRHCHKMVQMLRRLVALWVLLCAARCSAHLSTDDCQFLQVLEAPNAECVGTFVANGTDTYARARIWKNYYEGTAHDTQWLSAKEEPAIVKSGGIADCIKRGNTLVSDVTALCGGDARVCFKDERPDAVPTEYVDGPGTCPVYRFLKWGWGGEGYRRLVEAESGLPAYGGGIRHFEFHSNEIVLCESVVDAQTGKFECSRRLRTDALDTAVCSHAAHYCPYITITHSDTRVARCVGSYNLYRNKIWRKIGIAVDSDEFLDFATSEEQLRVVGEADEFGFVVECEANGSTLANIYVRRARCFQTGTYCADESDYSDSNNPSCFFVKTDTPANPECSGVWMRYLSDGENRFRKLEVAETALHETRWNLRFDWRYQLRRSVTSSGMKYCCHDAGGTLLNSDVNTECAGDQHICLPDRAWPTGHSIPTEHHESLDGCPVIRVLTQRSVAECLAEGGNWAECLAVDGSEGASNTGEGFYFNMCGSVWLMDGDLGKQRALLKIGDSFQVFEDCRSTTDGIRCDTRIRTPDSDQIVCAAAANYHPFLKITDAHTAAKKCVGNYRLHRKDIWNKFSQRSYDSWNLADEGEYVRFIGYDTDGTKQFLCISPSFQAEVRVPQGEGFRNGTFCLDS